MNIDQCFECEIIGVPIHQHHVVPRSRGGTKTIPLCEPCHSKAHHRNKNMNTSSLVKQAIHRLKKEGRTFGNPNINRDFKEKAMATRKKNAKDFAAKVKVVIDDLLSQGYKTNKDITEQLNLVGLKTRKGNKWKEQNVYRIRKYIDRNIENTYS